MFVNILRIIPGLLFAAYLFYQASRFFRVWWWVVTDNDYERGRPGWLAQAIAFNIGMFPAFLIAFGLFLLGLAFAAYVLLLVLGPESAVGGLLNRFMEGMGIGAP